MSKTHGDVNLFPIDKVVWDSSIYPREKWSTATIERYVDALEAGAEFPPIILEAETNRLLDGKQRLEAYKKAERTEIPTQWQKIPEGMSAIYFSASLSTSHGDRLSNADIKRIAEAEFEANPSLDPTEWGKGLGVSKSTVYRWVSHILEREKNSRANKAWRLSKLGWTQEEIGERLGVDQRTISLDTKNSHLGKIGKDLGEDWNDKGIAEIANRLNLNLTDCYAAAMEGMDDAERLNRLEIKIRPYDVWNFSSCHDLMGDNHPGQIPGELICHVLYFFTQPGSLVVDSMAGSGTVLDACLLMGRKARGYDYDIDLRHDRIDIEKHNLSSGWPETAKKADLIFWDPPYFDKMDNSTIGQEGYIEGSISGLSPEKYLDWFTERFKELKAIVKPGTKLVFLMSNWDSENAKQYAGHPGIWLWDYAVRLLEAGWKLTRHISCPLSTQQVHPDIINKFRDSRRLARLERYLLIGQT